MTRFHDLARTRSTSIVGNLVTRSRFDLRHAYWLARAAELVYSSKMDIVQELVEQWNLNDVEFLDVNDTQVVVAACDEFIVVSFRGTEQASLQDWITDGSTDLVRGPLGGKVHAGFYDALSHVWWLLDSYLRHLLDENSSSTDWPHPRPVFVTGHSLGAALATLAAARWLEAGLPVYSLYTFGQPRTGNNEFARNFNFAFKPHAFRFVNNNDLVTRIPPRSFGYSHLGSFKYFKEDGEFVEEISWWQRFLDGWRGRLEDAFSSINDGVRDHSMCEYRSRVLAACVDCSMSPSVHPPAIDRFLGSFLAHPAANSMGLRAA